MKYLIFLMIPLSVTAAQAQSTPTLVQQLSSYLAYEQAEADEECPGGGCYHFYRAARLTQQLAAAIAACNAGACLSPILDESGNVAGTFGTSAVSRGTN